MTANASHADRLACLAAGMNDHIGKPIDIDDVAPRILRLLERSLPLSARAEPLGSSPPPEVAIAPKVEFIEAPSSLLPRFGDRAQVLQNVFKHFPAECSRLLTLLQNQVQQHDVDGLGATLHAFKGVASTMGALALARRTSALEAALKQTPTPDVATLFNNQCLTELEQLTHDSVTLLDQVIRNLQPAPDAAAATTQADRPASDTARDWPALLRRIQPLLRTKNLRVLEARATLRAAAPAAPAAHAPDVRVLLDQLDAMQFEAALNTVDSLLAGTKP